MLRNSWRLFGVIQHLRPPQGHTNPRPISSIDHLLQHIVTTSHTAVRLPFRDHGPSRSQCFHGTLPYRLLFSRRDPQHWDRRKHRRQRSYHGHSHTGLSGPLACHLFNSCAGATNNTRRRPPRRQIHHRPTRISGARPIPPSADEPGGLFTANLTRCGDYRAAVAGQVGL
jgi:hypothetical protein